MKLLTVVGARPQFIKAAAVGYAIQAARDAGASLESVLVHTGQHYDFEMSRVFFDELHLQPPSHNLHIGSGSHGAQTGRMLEGLEGVIVSERPDAVLVYGDTNSTLAGALAAAKLRVPLAHVEAGLRSYNRHMPEELNRLVTDHLSTWLFCPTDTAVNNLRREGIESGVQLVGDVMYELVVRVSGQDRSAAQSEWSGVDGRAFVLATIHRAENTDDFVRLREIFMALCEIAEDTTVIAPLHPRTHTLLPSLGLRLPEGLRVVAPLAYGAMVAAQAAAAAVITDSGGVQKEAYWLGVPCVTVRDQTEWPETRSEDRNILVGADRQRIVGAVKQQLRRNDLVRPVVARASASTDIVQTLLAGTDSSTRTNGATLQAF